MMFKILTIVALVEVCACDTRNVNYHEPHNSVKHAISSQSFVRHDVPISYKHSEVHIYSTERPHAYGPKPITPAHQLPKLEFHPQEIQYAPVVREKKTEYTDPNIGIKPVKNLEPNLYSHHALVPGYNFQNLQVLQQTVNRYPGHNAVYRSYPNVNPPEKLNKQHDLNQLAVYDRQLETTPAISAFDFVPKQYKTESPSLFETGTELEAPQLAGMKIVTLEGYPPHPKTHRVLVNIARKYNFGKPPKDVALLMRKPATKNNKINQQRNTKPTNEVKTRLFPVKYKTLPQYS